MNRLMQFGLVLLALSTGRTAIATQPTDPVERLQNVGMDPYDPGESYALKLADLFPNPTSRDLFLRMRNNPILDQNRDGYPDLIQYLAGKPHHGLSFATVLSNGIEAAAAKLPFLGESMEVRFAPEIIALAAELDHDPVRILDWVYRNIENEPYQRSRKGALVTLLTKRGNDWDQSSLLVTLLRVSGIPARYAGIVISDGRVVRPYVQAWLPATPGIPLRTWVEGGRGAWFPMVPWHKQRELVDLGIDLAPWNAQTQEHELLEELSDFSADYLKQPTHETSVEAFERVVQNYLAKHHPGKTLADVPLRLEIVGGFSSLPRALPIGEPFEGAEVGVFSNDVPPVHRHKIQLRIASDSPGVHPHVYLETTIWFPQVAGRGVNIVFRRTSDGYVPDLQIDSETYAAGDLIGDNRNNNRDNNRTVALLVNTAIEGAAEPGKWKTMLPLLKPGGTIGLMLDVFANAPSVTDRLVDRALEYSVADATARGVNQRNRALSRWINVIVATYLERQNATWQRLDQLLHIRGVPTAYTGTVIGFIFSGDGGGDSTSVVDDVTPFGAVPYLTVHVPEAASYESLGRVTSDPTSWPGAQHQWGIPHHQVAHETPLHGRYFDTIWHDSSFQESEATEDWTYAGATSTVSGMFAAIHSDIDIVTLYPQDVDSDGRISYFNDSNHRVYLDQIAEGHTERAFHAFREKLAEPRTEFIEISTKPVFLPGRGFQYFIYQKGEMSAGYFVGDYNGGLPSQEVDDPTTIEVYGTLNGENYNAAFTFDGFSGDNDDGDIFSYQGEELLSQVFDEYFDESRFEITFNKVIVSNNDGQRIINVGEQSIFTSAQLDASFFSQPQVAQGLYVNMHAGSDISVQENASESSEVVITGPLDLPINPANQYPNAKLQPFGDPVYLQTGEFYVDAAPDIALPSRGLTLALQRTYGSQSSFNGPFGYGWSFSHAESLVFFPNENGQPDIRYYDARQLPFLIVRRRDGSFDYPQGTTFGINTATRNDLGVYVDAPAQPKLNVYVITYQDGSTATFLATQLQDPTTYDGRLLEKADRLGNRLVFLYTEDDRLAEIRDTVGQSLTLHYDANHDGSANHNGNANHNGSANHNSNGKITSVADSAGRLVHYRYNGDDLAAFTDLDGHTTQYEYFSGQENPKNNHNMSRYILPNGDSLRLFYYKNDRVSHHINDMEQEFRFYYSPINNHATAKDERGNTSKIYWDDSYNITREDHPDGTFATYEYDEYHNVLATEDASRNRVEFGYDTDNPDYARRRDLLWRKHILERADGDTPEVSETWNYERAGPAGRVSKVTDPLGYEIRIEYDNTTYQVVRTLIEQPAVGRERPDRWQLYPQGPQRSTRLPPAQFLTSEYAYDDYGNLLHEQHLDGIQVLAETYHRYDASGVYRIHTQSPSLLVDFGYDSYGRKKWTKYWSAKTQWTYTPLGRVTSITDRLGAKTELFYNENGQLVSHIAPNGGQTDIHYDVARDVVSLAQATSVTDPLGYVNHLAYDPTGNLVATTDANDHIATFKYDERNRRIQTTIAGHSGHMAYDGVGRLRHATDRNGNNRQYEYDGFRRITKMTDALGRETTIEYTHGQTSQDRFFEIDNDTFRVVRRTFPTSLVLRSEIDARGLTVRQLAYDSSQYEAPVVDGSLPGVRETRYRYDHLGRLVQKTNAIGETTAYTYTNAGHLVLRVRFDTEGNVATYIKYQVDGRGLRIREIDALGNETYYLRDQRDQIVAVVDAEDNRTAFEYDLSGNLTKVTDPLGYETHYTYNQRNELVTQTDPRGALTTFVYDPVGNLTEQFDPLGNRWTTYYDALGRSIGDEDPDGNFNSYSYDPAGRPISYTNALGHTVTSEYDALGRPTQRTDAAGFVWSRDYNDAERLIITTNPLGYHSTAEANVFGDVVRFEDQSGVLHEKQYDKLGRTRFIMDATFRESGIGPKGLYKRSYTALGRVAAEQRLLSNTTIGHKYDEIGRLAAVWVNRPDSTDATLERAFSYDSLSRIVSATDYNSGLGANTIILGYNARSEVVSSTQISDFAGSDVSACTITSSYDGNGNPVQTNYPNCKQGGQPNIVTMRYDVRNQLVEARDGTELVAQFSYDALGRPQTRTLGTTKPIRIDYTYDGLSREQSRSFGQGDAMLRVTHTEYDRRDNVTTQRFTAPQNQWSGMSPNRNYTYDGLNRLTQVFENASTTPKAQWDLDALGNWHQMRVDDEEQQFTANANNEYEEFGYDLEGNLVNNQESEKQYRYDWANRLISVNDDVQYTYDAFGRRVTRTRTDVPHFQESFTRYVYDGAQVIQERDDNNDVARTYAYGPGLDDPILMDTSEDRFFYLKDRMGSPWALTSQQGDIVEAYAYTAYGDMTVQGADGELGNQSFVGNPYGFTGRRWDLAANLWHYRSRDYNSKIGRFVQRDPAGFVDGANRYGYVRGNPLKYTDPLGLTAQNPRPSGGNNGGVERKTDQGMASESFIPRFDGDVPVDGFGNTLWTHTSGSLGIEHDFNVLGGPLAKGGIGLTKGLFVPLLKSSRDKLGLPAWLGAGAIIGGAADVALGLVQAELFNEEYSARRFALEFGLGAIPGGIIASQLRKLYKFFRLARSEKKFSNSKDVLSLANRIDGVTPTSTIIANSIRDGSIFVKELSPFAYRLFDFVMRSRDGRSAASAWFALRTVFLNKEYKDHTARYLGQLVHEGVHALDKLRGKAITIWREEARAWFAENQFLKAFGYTSLKPSEQRKRIRLYKKR